MSLLAAYSFDEAGNTVTDYSGNGNSFSIASTGVTRTVSGHTNGGATNSGSTAATLPSIGQTSNRTVMAWLKTATSPSDNWPLIWNVVSIPSGSWGILLLTGNLTIQARNASTLARAQTTWPTTNGVWHHIAGTYDGSNIRLYLDGTLQGSPVALAGPLRTDAAAPALFGYTENQIMDDLRIFDSAEDANITTWMNTPVSAPAIRPAQPRLPQAMLRSSFY